MGGGFCGCRVYELWDLQGLSGRINLRFTGLDCLRVESLTYKIEIYRVVRVWRSE